MKYIKEANDKYIVIKKVEGKPSFYKEALIYAYILTAHNPNPQIIQYLANHGAKFEAYREDTAWSPMHFWASNNDYKLLELAIKGGANVNFITPTSPLGEAKGARNKKLLKAAGAMTSEQLEKKFNIFYEDYDSSNEYCDLSNEAIRKDKEKENLQKN